MPIYEYRCTNGHVFEVMQSMSDEPVSTCQVCGAAVERVFHPVAVHFKGKGFYSTDYGRSRGGGAAASSTDSGESGGSSSDSGGSDKSGGSSDSGNGSSKKDSTESVTKKSESSSD